MNDVKYTQEDWDAVSDNPELTAEEFAKAVPFAQAVPELALRLLGVEGLAASEASDLLLQNRCLSIAGGTTQILRTAAAERILGLPRG